MLGDYSKANKELGWEPKTNFDDLVKMMVESDLLLAEREKVLIDNKLLQPTWEYPINTLFTYQEYVYFLTLHQDLLRRSNQVR